MRVAFFCTEVFASFGGIQRFNRALIRAMGEVALERDHQVKVLSINDPAQGNIPDIGSRVDFRGFGRHKLGFAANALLAAGWADLCLFGHVNVLTLGLVEPLFLRKYGSAVILHGVEAWHGLPRRQRHVAQRMTALISVSRFTGRVFCQENCLDDSRVILLPDTLDPTWSDRLDDDPQLEPKLDTPILLSVSRLASSEKYKGIDTVIKALPQMIRDVPSLKYIIVGDGDDRLRLQQLVDHFGLQKYVVFTGRVSEERLKGLYQQAAVFVLPSQKEGFGIVYLEAMAHARPVIAAIAGGTPEVVINGQTGRLVPYGDVPATGMAIRELLMDQDLCRRLGMAGRQRVREEFSFPIFKERVASILRKFEEKLNSQAISVGISRRILEALIKHSI